MNCINKCTLFDFNLSNLSIHSSFIRVKHVAGKIKISDEVNAPHNDILAL